MRELAIGIPQLAAVLQEQLPSAGGRATDRDEMSLARQRAVIFTHHTFEERRKKAEEAAAKASTAGAAQPVVASSPSSSSSSVSAAADKALAQPKKRARKAKDALAPTTSTPMDVVAAQQPQRAADDVKCKRPRKSKTDHASAVEAGCALVGTPSLSAVHNGACSGGDCRSADCSRLSKPCAVKRPMVYYGGRNTHVFLFLFLRWLCGSIRPMCI